MPPKPPELDKIERKYIGTRVGFTLAAIGCYFGTMFVMTTYGTHVPEGGEPVVILDQDKVWTTLQWLIGALSVAIIGDTARPSGMKGSAFSVQAKGSVTSEE